MNKTLKSFLAGAAWGALLSAAFASILYFLLLPAMVAPA